MWKWKGAMMSTSYGFIQRIITVGFLSCVLNLLILFYVAATDNVDWLYQGLTPNTEYTFVVETLRVLGGTKKSVGVAKSCTTRPSSKYNIGLLMTLH